MVTKTKKNYWETIYKTKNTTTEVSWYQDNPKTSVDLIKSTNLQKDSNIIDIGGGDSLLVDKLTELEFKNICVLDISSEALRKAKIRLGKKADIITWIESDVLQLKTDMTFDIWHDRATFHFLTEPVDIKKYVNLVKKQVKLRGFVILGTFSTNGPEECSGLPVAKYSKKTIQQTFGVGFTLLESFEEIHVTPFNTKQAFLWSVFIKN